MTDSGSRVLECVRLVIKQYYCKAVLFVQCISRFLCIADCRLSRSVLYYNVFIDLLIACSVFKLAQCADQIKQY